MRPHVAPSPGHDTRAALGCEACCAHIGKTRFSESCDGSGAARRSVPWYWRLVSAFGGGALFAATALRLARESISRTWSEAPHAGDGAALPSEAGSIAARVWITVCR